MANYDSVDLHWVWDGDYVIGPDGDLQDTSFDYIQSLKNELHTILRAEFDDWELNPNIATNISEFRGEPNTRETGKAIQDRCKSRIVAAGLVYQDDINVRVIPTSASQVLVVITINATATPANNLIVGDPLTVTFLYDTLEDSVFFLEPSTLEKQY